MHILSSETNNCPSWISRRERMTLENISRSISTKECCRPWQGLNPRHPGHQSDGASSWATEAGRMNACVPTGHFMEKPALDGWGSLWQELLFQVCSDHWSPIVDCRHNLIRVYTFYHLAGNHQVVKWISTTHRTGMARHSNVWIFQ